MAVIRVPLERKSYQRRQYRLDYTALEPGDKAALTHRTYGGLDVTVYTVKRLTASQLVCEATVNGRTWEARFRRDDGRQVGESDRWNVLVAVDDDEVLDAFQAKLMRKFRAAMEKCAGQRAETYDQRVDALVQCAGLATEYAHQLAQIEGQRRKESINVAA